MKYLLFLTIVLVIFLWSITANAFVFGDINDDDKIGLEEAIHALQVITDTTNAFVLGDINDDDKIGLEEAIYALQIIADIRPQPCDNNQLELCMTASGCAGAGMFWWSDNTCLGVPESETVTSAGQVWMDRNLGASRVATSPTDSEAYGDLYQWGRGTDGHEKRTSPTTSTNSSTDVPGHGNFITEESSPYDWRVPQNDSLWQGVSGTNNPCPAGFRLPTITELKIESNSWTSDNLAGEFASPLKLVMAGRRDFNGTFYLVGSWGIYWSGTYGYVPHPPGLTFDGAGGFYPNVGRAAGKSVRCIKN